MAQRTQHPLVYILLVWTTILSISMVVFITLIFSTRTQECSIGIDNLEATVAEQPTSVIKWENPKSTSDRIDSSGETHMILLDANYILNLQVTLEDCKTTHMVTLMGRDEILLQGRINTTTCSTGLLSRGKQLIAGEKLQVTISPSTKAINITKVVTYLDIILLNCH